jgi:hypothetical protein
LRYRNDDDLYSQIKDGGFSLTRPRAGKEIDLQKEMEQVGFLTIALKEDPDYDTSSFSDSVVRRARKKAGLGPSEPKAEAPVYGPTQAQATPTPAPSRILVRRPL